VADFSLNAANELAVQWLRQQGVLRATVAYDLSPQQLLGLAGIVPPEWLEVVIHGHPPLFHTAHCVFCAVFSPGADRSDCGRPCRQHRVHLQDRLGVRHVLKADADCRNTLFHGQPQTATEVLVPLRQRGVQHFRVELLDQTAADEVSGLIHRYCKLLECEGRSL
jgi:U32 family peptidase